MALINNAMQPQERPAKQAAPQSAGQNQVVDAAAKRIITAAATVLNQDDIEQQVIEMVRSAKSPEEGLANAAIFIMQALYEKSNGMPPQSMPPALIGILAMIGKMCKAAGVIEDDSPEVLQKATAVALQTIDQKGQEDQAPQQAPQPAPAQPEMGV